MNNSLLKFFRLILLFIGTTLLSCNSSPYDANHTKQIEIEIVLFQSTNNLKYPKNDTTKYPSDFIGLLLPTEKKDCKDYSYFYNPISIKRYDIDNSNKISINYFKIEKNGAPTYNNLYGALKALLEDSNKDPLLSQQSTNSKSLKNFKKDTVSKNEYYIYSTNENFSSGNFQVFHDLNALNNSIQKKMCESQQVSKIVILYEPKLSEGNTNDDAESQINSEVEQLKTAPNVTQPAPPTTTKSYKKATIPIIGSKKPACPPADSPTNETECDFISHSKFALVNDGNCGKKRIKVIEVNSVDCGFDCTQVINELNSKNNLFFFNGSSFKCFLQKECSFGYFVLLRFSTSPSTDKNYSDNLHCETKEIKFKPNSNSLDFPTTKDDYIFLKEKVSGKRYFSCELRNKVSGNSILFSDNEPVTVQCKSLTECFLRYKNYK